MAMLRPFLVREGEAEARRKVRERQAEKMTHWGAFDMLRRYPSEENARAAKRAFLTLAKVYHPDRGGNHEGFLRLQDAHERAQAVWKRVA